jgi:vancomycin resistance protein VanW
MARNRLLLLAGGPLLLFLLLAGLWLGLEYHFEDRIFYGVRIHNHYLGGLPRGEAASRIEDLARELETKPLDLYYGDRVWELIPEEIGIRLDRRAVLEEAYGVGRKGSLLEQVRERWQVWRRGREIELSLLVDEKGREEYFAALAREINSRPRNASLDPDTMTVIPGRKGLELEQGASWERLEAEIKNFQPGQVPLLVREIAPATSQEDILALGEIGILGQAVTVFQREEENRAVNIQLAAAALDGTIIEPGEILSFNDVVGPREPQYGFMEAPELVNMELVSGIGGGVCQVSSTLFHAALLAGMEVVERHCHSRPVAYIPLGLDATVVYNYLDLKLANRGISPLLLVARIREDRLELAVLGKSWTPEGIRLETGEIEEIEAPVEYVLDPTLPAGELLEEEAGAPGYRVQVERVVTLEGREIRREIVSDSVYLPRPRVFRRGPVPGN